MAANSYRFFKFSAAVRCFLLTLAALGCTRSGLCRDAIGPSSGRTSIQARIDAAQDGDTVIVSPGIYAESLTISGKSIVLASQFHSSGNARHVRETVLDGNGRTVITVDESAGGYTKIIGFTIQNGDDGISSRGTVEILHNHFRRNRDAIDFEGGRGRVLNNVFENNKDDAIDLDGSTAAVIEDNIIRNNDDDGIEIRLHAYRGSTLNVVIRNNRIVGNREDGIQLIDYPGMSDRRFLIERNLIQGNAMVGLGMMDDGDTVEDFRAAGIPEPILLVHNTFVDNPYAVAGGENLVAVNNLFVNSVTLALKGVRGQSIAAYNLFWGNAADHIDSNVETVTCIFADPLIGDDAGLQMGSPAINGGTAVFERRGRLFYQLPANQYCGDAPDLGWRETQSLP